MTVSSIIPVNNHTGNSSAKEFDFDFLIEKSSELKVYLLNEYGITNLLEDGVDYSIKEIGNPDGSYITFPLESSSYGVLQNNQRLSLMLDLVIKQENEFKNSLYYNIDVIEWTFDYIVRILQIFSRKFERTVMVVEGSDIKPDELLNSIKISEHNTQIYSELASNKADIASEKANEASASADLAKEWAIKTDDKVENIDYSAKYYAQETKNTASEALKNIEKDKTTALGEIKEARTTALGEIEEAQTTALENVNSAKTSALEDINNVKITAIEEAETAKTNAVNNINTLKEEALEEIENEKNSSLSSINQAENTSITVIEQEIQKAKDWATKTDAPVDGLSYGAKYYAEKIKDFTGVMYEQLIASKSYENNGKLIEDEEGYSSVDKYLHSTFDLTKYEVIGSPNITENGIASGLSETNYVLTGITLETLKNKSWYIEGLYSIPEKDAFIQMKLGQINIDLNGGFTLRHKSDDNILIQPYVTTGNDSGKVAQYMGDIILKTPAETLKDREIYIKYEFNYESGTYKVLYKYSAGDEYTVGKEYTATSTNKELYYINTNASKPIAQIVGSTGSLSSVDLKYLSIMSGGVVVFRGNKTGTDKIATGLEIPYTLSKTGSKIADAKYRDKVTEMYNKYGYAPYYTIDEENKNFTLPMGEIYGMKADKGEVEKQIEETKKTVESKITQEKTNIKQEIDNLLRPIGQPIFKLENKLKEDEIWLEGALVSKTTYSNLYNIYKDDYEYLSDKYEVNLDIVSSSQDINISEDLIASNFYAAGSLWLKNAFMPGTNPWEIQVRVKTPQFDGDLTGPIMAPVDSSAKLQLKFGINTNNHLYLRLSSNGSSWNLVSSTESTNQFEPLRWYDIRLSYTGGTTGTYIVEYYNGESWVEEIKVTNKAAIYQDDTTKLAFGSDPEHVLETRSGMEIDLKECKIKIGGKESYQILVPKSLTEFRLPDFRNHVIWGTSDNTYGHLEAELPNIRGELATIKSPANVFLGTQKGALYQVEDRSGGGYNASASHCGKTIGIDASKHNRIYNDFAKTVRPPAVKVRVATRYK